MLSSFSLNVRDISEVLPCDVLSKAMVLALHVYRDEPIPRSGVFAGAFSLLQPINTDELPLSIKIDGQVYVIDEDELSAVYKDTIDTTCAIYVHPDMTRWTRWSDADGRDSLTREFVYSGNREADIVALQAFVMELD